MPLQAFIVNRKLMPAPGGPKSWADLGKPEFKGQIIMANPALSGSAYAQLAQMLQLHGWDVVEKVVDNTTFVTSSKLVYQNVAKGENAVGITGDYNIVGMQKKGYPVECVYPSEGTGLRFDANGLIKGGPNPENGKLFLDFANSHEAHEIMVSLRDRLGRARCARTCRRRRGRSRRRKFRPSPTTPRRPPPTAMRIWPSSKKSSVPNRV